MTTKNILCYGDSNTWGFVPGGFDPKTFYMERYDRNTRWTSLLQKKLGENYYVIEEGLNGRTTNVNSLVDNNPDRNGKTYLPSCLYSHSPLDLVILLLGVNDLKVEFNRNAKDITAGLAELIEIIQTSKYGHDMQSSPDILVLPYPCPVAEHGFEGKFVGSIKRSEGFAEAYRQVAQKYSCHYLAEMADVPLSPIDGLHFEAAAHRQIADLLYPKVLEIKP